MIEPPVDPAEAPTNISSSSVIVASGPQSVVVGGARSPVVVMTATAWKTPVRTACLAGREVAGEQLEVTSRTEASAKNAR